MWYDYFTIVARRAAAVQRGEVAEVLVSAVQPEEIVHVVERIRSRKRSAVTQSEGSSSGQYGY